MKVKILADAEYQIVAVMDGDDCPAEDFILKGETTTLAARQGLLRMIAHVANSGLQNVPSSWFHEANKNEQIYEFIKGPLRLFFFKGEGRQIAICTSGIRKTGQKADKASVNKAAAMRKDCLVAIANNTYEVLKNETKPDTQNLPG